MDALHRLASAALLDLFQHLVCCGILWALSFGGRIVPLVRVELYLPLPASGLLCKAVGLDASWTRCTAVRTGVAFAIGHARHSRGQHLHGRSMMDCCTSEHARACTARGLGWQVVLGFTASQACVSSPQGLCIDA